MLLNVTVLIFWSSQGVYNYGYGIGDMAKYWSQHLYDKEKNDPLWPFRSNVEIIDYASNVTYCKSFLSNRLTKNPGVSAIMAPEASRSCHEISPRKKPPPTVSVRHAPKQHVPSSLIASTEKLQAVGSVQPSVSSSQPILNWKLPAPAAKPPIRIR